MDRKDDVDRRLELYEKIYFFEHERHYKINGTTTNRAATLTLLVGVLVYYAKALSTPYQPLEYWLLGLVSLGAISACVSAIFLALATFGWEYGFIATPEKIQEDLGKMEEWHAEHGATDDGGAGLLLDRAILEALALTATANYNTNLTKSMWVHRATAATLISLVACGLGFLPYVGMAAPAAATKAKAPMECRCVHHQADSGANRYDGGAKVPEKTLGDGGNMQGDSDKNNSDGGDGGTEDAPPEPPPPPKLSPSQFIKEGNDKGSTRD